MRFFTVDDGIKPWFRVAVSPYPRVFEGDWGGDAGGTFFCLPLGASLKRLIVEEDHEYEIRLEFGKLLTTASAGKVIVKQTRGEAGVDELALVLLVTQPGESGHVWYSAMRGYPIPRIIGSIPIGVGCYYKHLLLFSKGQALIVEREGRFTGPARLSLMWDGRWLASGGPPAVKKQYSSHRAQLSPEQ